MKRNARGAWSYVVTCEHATNHVPARYRRLFAGAEDVLSTHRAYDPGAKLLANRFAKQLGVSAHCGVVSRLIIELNRSIGHPRLYSEFMQSLDTTARRELLDRNYMPYRSAVEAEIGRLTMIGRRVCHVSVHSFTPVLDGDVRRADIGLLYDPVRTAERTLCRRWQSELQDDDGGIVVRCNYPYRGNADGFTTYLRKQFAGGHYLGIELEVNQHWPLQAGSAWRRVQTQLVTTFVRATA
ncbi:MAG: N-formylglutamate amidohydrolase [Planctomycetales bacterium]|nr:N-formylglutamate amidohydrolase [Planctomycetales bacterium]